MWPGSWNGLGNIRQTWWAEGEGPRAGAPPGLGCPVPHCPVCSVGAAWGGCFGGPVRVTQAFTAGSYWLLYMISKLPHDSVGRRQVGTVSWESDPACARRGWHLERVHNVLKS